MAYPPPPPYNPTLVQEKPPVVGWLVPVAGVLALIGAFAPWFSPQGTLRGQVVLAATDNLHSWEDGKIGLVGPIVLIAVSIGVVGLLTGRTVSSFGRGSAGPVVAAGRVAMVAGVVTLAAVAIAWFLVPGQYDQIPADAGGSWDGAEKLGIDLTRGPQLGYWLTIAGAVVALVGGGLMLVLRTKPQPATAPVGEVVQQPGFPPPDNYPPPAYPQQPYPQQAPPSYQPQQAPPGYQQPPPSYQPQQAPPGYQQPPPSYRPQQAPPSYPPQQNPHQGGYPPPPGPGSPPQQGWAPPPPRG